MVVTFNQFHPWFNPSLSIHGSTPGQASRWLEALHLLEGLQGMDG